MSESLTAAQSREPKLLAAARGGDERAFHQLIEPYRRELQAQCYRMLGSVHDAEDALQEALLRAWKGLPGFKQRSSLRTWLYKITTNVCLAVLEKRPRQALPMDYGPAADAGALAEFSAWSEAESWVEPIADGGLLGDAGLAAPSARYEQRESIELAFMAAFQHLLPNQRAVLLLRDVLAFSANEVAELLDTTVASVTSALQRARKAVEEQLPERSQQANLRSLGDTRVRRLVDAYVAAWERKDMDAILAMLAEDVTFTMPPYTVWFHGRESVAEFLPRGPLTESWRLVPVRASGQLAFGCYRWAEETGLWEGNSLDVLTLDGERITQVTAFLTPEILPRFALPTELVS